MSHPARCSAFLVGIATGLLVGIALLLLPVLWLGTVETVAVYGSAKPWLSRTWNLVDTNLKGSLLPFLFVMVAWWLQLARLRILLDSPEPPLDRVVRHEQLLELYANLFFGIGVIWTAIGMRNALLYALGDPDVSATEGAFAILQRLVDGGILLALSTTIVGGIGGYLMRAIKSVSLGRALNALYYRASQEPAEHNLAALHRIEQLLHSSADRAEKSSS